MTDVYEQIDALLAPLREATPGISNGEVAKLLPEHLRQPFWQRAVERYLEAELAKLHAKLRGVENASVDGSLL